MPHHTTRSHRLSILAACALVALGGVGVAGEAKAAPASTDATVEVYRLYNPFNPEHLYTTDENEYQELQSKGWEGEGVYWLAPSSAETQARRLQNPYTGEHLLSADVGEIEALAEAGWILEGSESSFGSAGEDGVPVTRLFNPFAEEGSCDKHVLTVDQNEVAELVSLGWKVDEPADPSLAIYAAALPGEACEPAAPEEPPAEEDPADPTVPEEPDPDVDEGEDPEGPDASDETEDPLLWKRLEVLEFARSLEGWPYVWAGESPEEGGFDCSGLVQYVYQHFGYDLPRTTYDLEHYLKATGAWRTHIEDFKIGDILVMNESGHVGIFAGKDPDTGRYMMVDAGTRYGVSYREIYSYYYPEYNSPLQGGGSIF